MRPPTQILDVQHVMQRATQERLLNITPNPQETAGLPESCWAAHRRGGGAGRVGEKRTGSERVPSDSLSCPRGITLTKNPTPKNPKTKELINFDISKVDCRPASESFRRRALGQHGNRKQAKDEWH